MSEQNGNGVLSIMEAINILSNMSEIDIKEVGKKQRLNGRADPTDIDWKNPEQALLHKPLINETFRVLHRYLQNMVRNDQNIIKDAQTMKGVQALMLLAEEAAIKMDKYAKVNLDKSRPISSLKEYTDLQKYYKQHILKQMKAPPEALEDWEEALEGSIEQIELAEKRLGDLESVRGDRHYELFYIKNEEGERYFDQRLLRHIRLIGNFDEFIGKVEGEDPLLALREVLDHQLLQGAAATLQITAPYIDEFYKEAKLEKARTLVWNLNKALMALRMAANAKNLIEQQSFKSCLEYYSDFHRFLRIAMQSSGYIKRITKELPEDHFGHVVLRATHALCCDCFMRKASSKRELKLIHQIIERGAELEQPKPKGSKRDSWHALANADASLRYLLKHYPNGPILRILDALREQEELEGYDPLIQKNFPSQLFTLENKQLHLSILRIPCPVKQESINRAEIVEEFKGFLRYYKYDLKPDQHLLINLQNRTSWEEHARCKALEDLRKKAEFNQVLSLLGLATGTSFYHQEEEHESINGAPVFIEQFIQQILDGEECGYSLPTKLKEREHKDFIKDAMAVCHALFFDGKATLKQMERCAFIDIFYLLYTYWMIDRLNSDSVSFTCKDAIDTGAAYAALFYTFTRLVSDPNTWGEEDRDTLLWFLYSPALFIRERAIQQDVLERASAAMQIIHKSCLDKGKRMAKELNQLYDTVQFPFQIKLD